MSRVGREGGEEKKKEKGMGASGTKEWADTDQAAIEHKREHEKSKRGREDRERKRRRLSDVVV